MADYKFDWDKYSSGTEPTDKLVDKIIGRLDEVNTIYIKKIAEQIRTIGELNPSSLNKIEMMSDMGTDVADINRRLQEFARLSRKDLYKLYDKALNETYSDSRFEEAIKEKGVSKEGKERLERFARNISIQTANDMQNFSNTTVISENYRNAVDKAIMAVYSGVTDYNSAVRDIIREIGYNGLQLEYESGYHRRMDTALKQNIIDGVRQIRQTSALMIGEELGYDAVELSAHLRSAPDHEPVQGRVFLKAEFEKMQNGENFKDVDGNNYSGFERPIGQWNCRHLFTAFSTQYSIRAYTDEQLEEYKRLNHKGCEIDGKHYTIYEASQLMRRIETEIRRQKGASVAAKTSGDTELRKECQRKINVLSAKYYQVANKSNIRPSGDRLTVEGFRAVKLTFTQKDGIISNGKADIPEAKLTKYLLKSGTTHYSEFTAVGYSQKSTSLLAETLLKQFDMSKARDFKGYPKGGTGFVIEMQLGKEKTKPFITVWQTLPNGNPRFVTAYRKGVGK